MTTFTNPLPQYRPCTIEDYTKRAFVHHEIARRMVEYLEADLAPQSIWVDGARDHYLTELLQARFPEAVIYENIYDNGMADPQLLRVDMVISNLYLQDLWELEDRIRAYQLALNAGGKLFFTTIGVGSFQDLSHAEGPAINQFPDIEDIGDFLHALGFKNAVLFIEKINLTYERLSTLLLDAKAVAGKPFTPTQGLRTRHWIAKWYRYCDQFRKEDGIYEIGLDVIYAEGSLSDIKNIQGQSNEVYVDINNLKKPE
ncbi:hypothetical protein WMO13_00735 [Ignatzschineria larvae DSM 13226]|uniref:Methyltransferase domain-containing protein n=1 Tax=Ignatzschineria larvae DSM 13226 TaxID=1111732 RepID=A0ABZ3BZY5_9GAMM|nr:hypothetical protein [Ignatzschineria larvae]